MEQSYWNGKGKYQAAYNELNKLIPVEGACANPRSTNKHLDAMRRAANAYYDIFNNGGWNRSASIRCIFGIIMSRYTYGRRNGPQHINWAGIMRVTEPIMDQLILAAAIEQNVPTVTLEVAEYA